jgi:hypothetical protein
VRVDRRRQGWRERNRDSGPRKETVATSAIRRMRLLEKQVTLPFHKATLVSP